MDTEIPDPALQQWKAMNVLSIGGSDPSAGAGIQSDIRTAQLLDSYCLTVVTAITGQNTSGYHTTTPVPARTILRQIESVTSDFEVDVIKIGMVYDSKTIAVLHGALRSSSTPIVVDPVIRSTTGGVLLKKESVKDFQEMIVPLAYAITPNVEEAEAVSGIKMTRRSDIRKMADRIVRMGTKNVVITGIDEKDGVADLVRTKSGEQKIVSGRIRAESHGGGCTFSAALAVSIAGGADIFKAARFAGEFARRSIIGAKRIGRGVRIAEQRLESNVKDDLAGGIAEFVTISNIHRAIPECQTNFVFSRHNPRRTDDIAGVAGRIVRAGEGVIVAGGIELGGSRHVASAVLEVSRRFPEIRSGVNVRYDAKALNRLKSKRLTILSYDRGAEPARTKRREGSSVPWGIKSAIAGAESAPDVIFHMGDWGKEPMMLVFGETPQKVVDKIRGVF